MSSKCPPVTVNVDDIVEAAKKKVLQECPSISRKPVEADVHAVGIRGLGRIALVEEPIRPEQFVLGYVTIPTVVNFVTKLMQVGVFTPQVDLAVSRGAAAGMTLIGTLLSKGNSFLLGAFLGQFPSTLDALADVVVSEIAKKSKGRQEVKGLGVDVEEIEQLRQELRKLSRHDERREVREEEMEGVRFYS